MTVKFGQVIMGPPGAGKSTYCAGLYQYFQMKGRPTIIVNLDPQVTPSELPYEPHIDVCELVDSAKVSDKLQLGPNATLVYCMEHLVANLDWLEQQLEKYPGRIACMILKCIGAYILYDTPGQIELFTHHRALVDIVEFLQGRNQRLTGVALMDCTLCANPFNYVSALLTCLSAQIQLQLPHVNVLSKIDLLKLVKSDLAFNIDFYTEAGDLQQLLIAMRHWQKPVINSERFNKFTATLCELIEDFNMVSFGTLDIQDPDSIAKLVAKIDKCTGYITSHI